jgi:nicotinamidase-related amidase
MSNPVYRAEHTGLLLVDPYNDFLSHGGKIFPMIEGVANDIRLLDNLRATVWAARKAGIRVFYVPHRRWQPGDYEDWEHPNPTQRIVQKRQSFAKGTWGGEWHPDFVPQENDIVIRALGAKRFREHRSRFPAQAAQNLACHHGWSTCEHLH